MFVVKHDLPVTNSEVPLITFISVCFMPLSPSLVITWAVVQSKVIDVYLILQLIKKKTFKILLVSILISVIRIYSVYVQQFDCFKQLVALQITNACMKNQA